MADQIAKFNTRIQHRYDEWNEAGWLSTTGQNLVPLKGELCIAHVPANPTADGEVLTEEAYLIKIGDGVNKFADLPWISSLAADVHPWAKETLSEFQQRVLDLVSTGSGDTVADLGALRTEFNNFVARRDNPHVVTKGQVGLGNVENYKAIEAELDTDVTEGHIVVWDDAGSRVKDTGVSLETLTGQVNTNKTDIGTAKENIVAATNLATEAKTAATKANTDIAAMDYTALQNPDATNPNISFIKTIKQENGKVTATRTTIPTADNENLGLVRLGGSGASAAATQTDMAAAQGRLSTAESNIAALQNQIANAIHFKGSAAKNSAGTEAITEAYKSSSIYLKQGDGTYTEYTAQLGDVVLSGGFEFIYVATNTWEQLGQEGSFITVGTKFKNVDIATDAAIEQTKIATVLGKTSLSGDITHLDTQVKEALSNASAAAQAATNAQSAADNAQAAADAAQEAIDDALTLTQTSNPTAATSFVSAVGVNSSGSIEVTTKPLPVASTGTAGIVKLGATGGAATYTKVEDMSATLSAVNTAVTDSAWKTSNVNTSTDPAGLSTSNLTIGSKEIKYIVFDCGSATTNT